MITVFSLYGITATANFCWHRKHLKITKSLKYSFNFRCYGFYVTTFKSFIFLLDTSDTYTFNVASIGNECWSKFLTCFIYLKPCKTKYSFSKENFWKNFMEFFCWSQQKFVVAKVGEPYSCKNNSKVILQVQQNLPKEKSFPKLIFFNLC